MRLAGYCHTAGYVVAAAAVRAALDPVLGDKAPLLVFPAAVAASAWRSGYAAGFFATGLSLPLGMWWFAPGDLLSALRAPGEVARAWLFIGEGVLLTVLTGALQERRSELQQLVRSEREARAAAELALKQRDHLLAIASHELRTPLNVILGWSSQLRRVELPPGHQRAVEAIYRNARAQASVVEDLLDAAMAFAGVMTIDREPVDVAQVAADAAASVRRHAEDKGVGVTIDAEALPRYVVGDGRRLTQAIQKVAENAVKFTPPGGTVRISTRTIGQHFEVRVEDSGVGIAPEFLPRLFQRFTQQDQTGTRAHGGLGLGLAIVKEVVERHGGTVSASSPGIGCGAVFTLTFPIALRAVTVAPEPAVVLTSAS